MRTVSTIPASCVVVSLLVLGAIGCRPEMPGDAERIQREAAALADLLRRETADRREDELALRFYAGRKNRPAWTSPDGARREVEGLLAALESAGSHGLDPARYAPDRLRRRLEDAPDEDLPARLDLDLELTRAFFRHAVDLQRGRIDPADIGAHWSESSSRADPVAALEKGLEHGDVAAALESLSPPHEDYHRLRDALGRYRAIARDGGWPTIPPGPTLEPGETADPKRLTALYERLRREGFAGRVSSPSQSYGKDLAEAVTDFQRLRGLEPTGRVGERTLARLNLPANEWVRTIELNLERWRWLPEELGERHVLVDVPAFRLAVHHNGAPIIRMRIVVGKPQWETPVFSDRIEYIVINPEWNVPQSIAKEELLPKARRDPGYLERKGYEIVSEEGAPIPPSKGLDAADVRIRQKPGANNALGRVKFMFPNPFAVYLHDTPAGELFEKTRRAFSHGCIRVEQPVELAETLLETADGDGRTKIREAIASKKTQRVNLTEPVPIYILYRTALVNEANELELHPDVYEVDRTHARALEEAGAAG